MYDYIFKIMLLGENSEGKAYFARNFCNQLFNTDTKLTIGVDFHIKLIRSFRRTIKFQIWDVDNKGRFKFLCPIYCLGANAAIIIYDFTNSTYIDYLAEQVEMIREKAGDIPIILISSKLDLDENSADSREEGVLMAENYNLFTFAEISPENGQNLEQIFEVLGDLLIERYSSNRIEVADPPKLLKFTHRKIKPEFIVNGYLKLRLENDMTNIYVNGKLFNQCKYLLLNIPVDNVRDYNEIKSIDEAAERLDSSMEGGGSSKYYLSPKTEFWGHCSNLQAWYENDYDTRILHRNLAFPLLEALVKVGDPLAKKVFKEEIALRLESGYPSVCLYLINQGYLGYLSQEELNTILENPKIIKNLSKWCRNSKFIPKWLLEKIRAKINHQKR